MSEKKINSDHKKLNLSEKYEKLEKLVNELYLSDHAQQMMRKIGIIGEQVGKIEQNVKTCYDTIFMVFLLFVLCCGTLCYIIWRSNKFFAKKVSHYKPSFIQTAPGRLQMPLARKITYQDEHD